MNGFFSKILKSGFGVLTSRIFGLLRDVAVAAFYGASGLTDAFFMAFAVPNLFRAFFAEGALSSAFVPFLSDNIKKCEKRANKYLTGLLFTTIAIILPLSLIIMIFSDQAILLFMPGYAKNPEVLAAGSFMLRVLMPYLLMVTICALLSGYLNVKGSYYVPHSSTAILNIFMIAGAYIGYRGDGDIIILCYSVFLGGIAQVIYVLAFTMLKGFRFSRADEAKEDVKKTFRLMVPSMLGVGITQLNFLVGRVAASFLMTGSISYLYYANRLFQFPLGLFGVAVGTVSLTEISKANSSNDMAARKKLIDKSILSLVLVILPATAGLMLLSYDITKIVYARKEFMETDITNTSSALVAYSAGLLFYSLINVLSRVFHSEKDTKTPVKAALISFIFYCVFMFLLTPKLGHVGIAVASSISAFSNTIYLYVKIRNYNFSFSEHFWVLWRVVFATFLMSLAAVIIDKYELNVLINISVCIVIYFGTIRGLGISIKRFIR